MWLLRGKYRNAEEIVRAPLMWGRGRRADEAASDFRKRDSKLNQIDHRDVPRLDNLMAK